MENLLNDVSSQFRLIRLVTSAAIFRQRCGIFFVQWLYSFCCCISFEILYSDFLTRNIVRRAHGFAYQHSFIRRHMACRVWKHTTIRILISSGEHISLTLIYLHATTGPKSVFDQRNPAVHLNMLYFISEILDQANYARCHPNTLYTNCSRITVCRRVCSWYLRVFQSGTVQYWY